MKDGQTKVVLTGIDAMYEGYYANSIMTEYGTLFSILAVSPETRISGGSVTLSFVTLAGIGWNPEEGLACTLWVGLSAEPESEDSEITKAFQIDAIGSGTLDIAWSAGTVTSSEEDPQNWEVSEGITDANASRITVTGITGDYTEANLRIRAPAEYASLCSHYGPIGNGSLSTLLEDWLYDTPWIGEEDVSYNVELTLYADEDDISGTSFFYNSAFTGGSVQTISLDFADFTADTGL